MTPPQELAGYKVLATLGEGAASIIYAVQDPRTKQVWALKHVEKHSEKDQRFIEQTETEYEVGSKLDHQSIRGVERLVKHRRRFKVHAVSLVLELVDGATLDQAPPRSHAQAVRIFANIAAGLAHMHGRGFVHADMKPNNVLRVGDGDEIKIVDLGQACRIGTVKKRIQGTPGYMAPEQAHRQSITPATDIYNFGATMYWVLCRDVIPTALPPKDDSANSLYSGALDAEQVEPPVPPADKDPSIHPLLSRQVLDCVKIAPEDRPESMEVVLNRLQMIADLLESEGHPPIVDDETTTL